MKIILLFLCLAIGVTIGGRLKRSSGGREITIDQAPYFVFLKRDGHNICGGALISTRHVLTAAGCVVGFEGESLTLKYFYTTRVVSGMDTSDTTAFGRTITNISPHDDYRKQRWWCNIAVITLSAPVESNEKQMELPLPNEKPLYGTYATLTTQTRIKRDTKSSVRQMDVKLHYADGTFNETYSFDGLFYASLRRGTYVSRIDLGAPIVYEGAIIGIVSTISRRNNQAFYGLSAFTFKTFITESMGEEASLSSEASSEIPRPAKRPRL